MPRHEAGAEVRLLATSFAQGSRVFHPKIIPPSTVRVAIYLGNGGGIMEGFSVQYT